MAGGLWRTLPLPGSLVGTAPTGTLLGSGPAVSVLAGAKLSLRVFIEDRTWTSHSSSCLQVDWWFLERKSWVVLFDSLGNLPKDFVAEVQGPPKWFVFLVLVVFFEVF